MQSKRCREKSPTFGKMWIHNRSIKSSRLHPKSDKIPAGWERGRVMDFDIEKRDPSIDYVRLAYDKKIEANKNVARELFEKFKESEFKSIGEFARANNTSQPRLSMLWKRHIPEFCEERKRGKSFKDATLTQSGRE